MTAPLYPFQADAIERLAAAERGICLAFEMGLGKTRTVIEAAARVGAKRVLVIAPKIATVVWPVEVQRWSPGSLCLVLRPREGIKPFAGTTFAVINYEALPLKAEWIARFVKSFQPDLVVLDECHYLKNHSAKRTRIIYGPRCDGVGGVISDVPRVWLMSGTPAPNYTAELWTHFRSVYPQAIEQPKLGRPMNQWEFQRAYSVVQATQYGDRVVGSKNTLALRQAAAGFFIRARVQDVLKDLPPIVWSTEPVEADMPALPRELQHLEGLDGDALLEELRDSNVALSTVRRLMAMAKVDAAAAWIDYFFENNPDRSLVVFAHHRDVLAALHGQLAKHLPLLVHGGTPLALRAEAVQLFQARKRKLWLGQMQASGTAITLTAASDVLFVELDWTPATVAQAAARTHRIGQNKVVMARALYIADSLDDAIARTLTAKAAALRTMFDNQKESA